MPKNGELSGLTADTKSPLTAEDLKELEDHFRSGRLIRPSHKSLNFIDLVLALSLLTGAGAPPTEGAKELSRTIGPSKRYVFILIDALGLEMLETLPPSCLMRSSFSRKLQTVFLSSTAAALTSLATGLWPNAHSVPGWWTFIESHNINAVTLPFLERDSGNALERYGLTAGDIYPVPSFWKDITFNSLNIMPEDIVDSTYAMYAGGGNRRRGYRDLENAFELLASSVLSSDAPSITYLYLPHLDHLSHIKGPYSEAARNLLLSIDRYLLKTADSLADKARIVISADHGQITVPEDRRFDLEREDTLLSYLRCIPTGEPSVPIFHTIKGEDARFYSEFKARFGDSFLLLANDQIEGLELFGPGPLSPIMKERIGSFMGIPFRPSTINIRQKDGTFNQNIGVHGGLSRSEMYIPLMLI